MTDLTKTNSMATTSQTNLSEVKRHIRTLDSLRTKRHPASGTTFILGDISGSMSGRKLDALKDAYRTCWQPNIRALVFGSDVYEVGTKADIDTLHTDGSTSMMAGLQVAWSENAAHIILISDGEPTDASKSQILDAARKAGVPIDTIAISDRGQGFDDQFLQQLASATSGNFNRCDEPLKLTQMVEMLLIGEKGSTETGPGVIQL